MAKINIEIPSEFTFVRGVRICVSSIAYNFGFSDREVYQIESVVDEVCNNAVEYGDTNNNKSSTAKNTIKVECDFKTGELELAVTDRGGKRFNLQEVLKHNKRLVEDSTALDNLNKRGRGLIIVQRFVDELDIDTNNNQTTVRVVKKAKRR